MRAFRDGRLARAPRHFRVGFDDIHGAAYLSLVLLRSATLNQMEKLLPKNF